MSLTMHLKRGLYRDEDRVILPAIQQFESAYDILLKIPTSINVLTAIQKLKARDERFRDIEVAYSMLSDFVHPNMASHCAVIEMPRERQSMHECVMSRDPSDRRGEFFMVVTLPWAAMSFGNFVELLPPLGRLLRTGWACSRVANE